jgi:hypothetical protein
MAGRWGTNLEQGTSWLKYAQLHGRCNPLKLVARLESLPE